MKKRLLHLVVLVILVFSLTGCIKFNATMEIKKDKSLDFSIIYAFDTSLVDENQIKNAFKDSDKKELEKNGFTLTNYSDGKMKGYTISKKVKNIDEISSSNEVKYNLSGMAEKDKSSGSMFKVEKGFLKNKYVAKFEFSAVNDAISGDNDELENNTEEDTELTKCMPGDPNTKCGGETNEDNSNTDLSGLTDMMNSMDMSFNVKLPYSAISSNAHTKNDNNKNLYWNLASNDFKNVEFTFALYNMTNIYIILGGVVLVILLGIFALTRKKKNKDDNGGIEQPITSVEQNIEVPVSDNSSVTVPENQGLQAAISNNVVVQQPVVEQPVIQQPVVNPTPVVPTTVQPVQPVVEPIQPQVNNAEDETEELIID